MGVVLSGKQVVDSKLPVKGRNVDEVALPVRVQVAVGSKWGGIYENRRPPYKLEPPPPPPPHK